MGLNVFKSVVRQESLRSGKMTLNNTERDLGAFLCRHERYKSCDSVENRELRGLSLFLKHSHISATCV